MAVFDDMRSDWSARPSDGLTPVPASSRTEFMSHWNGSTTGVSASDDHAKCLAFVRAVQAFHMDDPKHLWADIGYNGLICPHGRSIEGRGLDVQGAHCSGHNVVAYGFTFIVGSGERITDAAKSRMSKVYQECAARAGALSQLGHRDGSTTDCPGDEIYIWVRAGMPDPLASQEDPMDAAQFKALMDAVGKVAADVAALQSTVATLQAGVTQANTHLDGLAEEIATTVPQAVTTTLDSALGGFEITAQFVRQKEDSDA